MMSAVDLVSLQNTFSVPRDLRYQAYVATSRNPLFEKPWQFQPTQIHDHQVALHPDISEVMYLRNRGGSKTRDLVVLAVFLGYQKNDLGELMKILWFSGTESQLQQVSTYFFQNWYVDVAKSSFFKVVLKNGNIIHLSSLTKNRAVSKRADVIICDEEQSFDKEIYQLSLGSLIGGDIKIIHAGTTEIGTVLEENFNRLKGYGRVLTRTLDDCKWINKKKTLHLYSGQPQWVLDSQLYCKWVRAGGLAFPRITTQPISHINWNKIFLGVDPNPVSGYAMVATSVHEDTLFVFKEFEPIANMRAFADLLISYLRRDNVVGVEIEKNAGESFLNYLEERASERREYISNKITIKHWSSPSKFEDVLATSHFNLIFDNKLADLTRRARSAAWDTKSTTPRLIKNEGDHFLDATIHAAALAASYDKNFITMRA